MSVKVVKGRPPRPEFIDAPDGSTYSGEVRATYTPNRIPYTFFGENQVRDNSMYGTVAGTPGTLPANIAISNAAGLTSSVSANEVIDGLTYTKINFDGTSTGVNIILNLEDATSIAATNGQVWGYAAYIGLGGSDTSKVSSYRLRLGQRTSGGGLIANLDSAIFTSISATPVRRSVVTTLTGGATVAFISPQLLITIQTAQTVHLTVYIAMHTLELNSIRNQPTGTYGYPQPSVWVPESPIKVDPKRLGALGDSIQATDGSWTGTDDTVALARACGVVRRMQGGAILDLSEGCYTATDQIISAAIDGFRMQGRGDDSRIIMKSAARDNNFVLFDFTGTLNQNGVPTATGANYLTSPLAVGGSILTMNSTAGLVADQWMQMIDTSHTVKVYFDVYAGTDICWQGQPVQIQSVDSSTQVTIYQRAEFDYPASVTQFKLYDTAMKTDLVFENFVIDYDKLAPMTNTQTRFRFKNISNIKAYNLKMFHVGNGLTFDASMNIDVDTCHFFGHGVLLYCVSFVNGAGMAHCHNLLGYNCRHLVQGGADLTSIEAQHILVTGSRGESFNIDGSSGGIPFAGHVAMRNVDYIGNMAIHCNIGHQLRGRWMRAVDSINTACGYGIEIADCCGDGSEVVGGMIRACDVGIRVARATKAVISGSPHIINSKVTDVRLENQFYNAPFTPYPGLKIVDLRVEGTPSAGNITYLMRTADGQVTPTYGDDWEINVRGITNKPTFKVVNADGVTDSTIPFMGEHAFKQATKTASFTCLVGQNITYIVQPAASAIAVTVPDATLWTGERSRLRFVKSGVGAGVITLTAVSGNINGAASAVLTTFMTIESDGTNWFVVA